MNICLYRVLDVTLDLHPIRRSQRVVEQQRVDDHLVHAEPHERQQVVPQDTAPAA